MEKIELLNSIFDSFIEDMKTEKENLILSIKKNDYNQDRYKNCSRLKTIVAHLFFMAILKYSPTTSDFIDGNHPFVEYIRWNSVFVKPFSKNKLPPFQLNQKAESQSKLLKLQSLKNQAKKLFSNSLQNLSAAECLKLNELYSQSVHYSQMAAELGIKSVLRAKNISHTLWKCEHSIINLGNGTRCFDAKFLNLCESLETLGLNDWKNTNFEKSSTLSIRTRYCDYDDNAYMFLDTLPSKVFTCKLAKKAYFLSEEILFYCEDMLNETWKPKNMKSND